ncbi:MAG: SAM-dependent methyltransferase [Acidimicrobiales bacterium]
MVDVHRYHQISESTHRIMNPLSFDRMMLVGDICRLTSGDRLLDLACGKGEMLCQFAARYGVTGVGVDIFMPSVSEARARAAELGVEAAVVFREGDAAEPLDLGRFDAVSCIGASWIGGGLAGTFEIMKRHVEPGGWVLVGDVYWKQAPSAELADQYGQEFADLAGTLELFEAAGLELVEMVLTNDDDWDRYAASQWLNVSDWLIDNPDDRDAADVLAQRDESRCQYLTEGRATLGWGVFVGRVPGNTGPGVLASSPETHPADELWPTSTGDRGLPARPPARPQPPCRRGDA